MPITMKKKHILLLLIFTLAISSCVDANGHLNEIRTGLLVGAIGGILIVIWQGINRYKAIRAKKQTIKDALGEREDFTESTVIKGEGENLFYLATDDTRKKVFYVFGEKKVLCDYKDIASVNIEENGAVVVSKKSLGSALAGAILGEAVIGGDKGAILGAATFGKTTNQQQITSMFVHVSLRNQPYSSLDFKCFDNGGEPLPQGHYRVSYQLATIRAQELYDLFRAIIDETDAIRIDEEKRIEAEKKEEQKQVGEVMQRITAAQELIDVAGLYMQGLITDEEYAKMKERIIGSD